MPTSPVGKFRLPMTRGGRVLGVGLGAVDGAEDGRTGVGDGGAVEAVASALGVVTAGLSEGVTFATGLGDKATGARAHPLATMTNPAMRAADVRARFTPS
jgi:hypothetical protein